MDYHSRINMVDSILSIISNNNETKFYILFVIHYLIFLIPLVYFYITTKNKFIFYLCFLLILIQLGLNILDNGCFLLKLERKYIGKEWMGLYKLTDLILPDFITIETVRLIYIQLVVIGLIYGIYNILFYKFK